MNTLIPLILLKQRDDAQSVQSLHAVCSKTGSRLKLATAICVSALHFRNCDMYTALHFIYATAICISALHCGNCDMYICNTLYILQLRYVYRHCTLYNTTAICISAMQLR